MTGSLVCAALLVAIVIIAVFGLSYFSFREAVRESHRENFTGL